MKNIMWLIAGLLAMWACMPIMDDEMEDDDTGENAGSPSAETGGTSAEGGAADEGGTSTSNAGDAGANGEAGAGGSAGATDAGGSGGVPSDGGVPSTPEGGSVAEGGEAGTTASGGEPGTVGAWPGGFLQYDLGPPLDIAVDPAGNMFVLLNRGFDQSGYEISHEILKFDATGALLWSREPQYDEDFAESPVGDDLDRLPRIREIATDNDGNVYFVGSTSGVFPGEPDRDYLDAGSDWCVGKFDPDGETVWIHQFGVPPVNPGSSRRDIIGLSIAVSAAGSVFIAGLNDIAVPDQINEEHDPIGADPNYIGGVYIAKYDTDGVRQWVTEFGREDAAPVNADFGLRNVNFWGGLAADNAGNVYLSSVGVDGTSTEQDPYILKCNPNGEREWLTRIHEGVNDGWTDIGFRISVSTDGKSVYLGGTTRSDFSQDGFPSIRDPSGLSGGIGASTGFVGKLDGGDGTFLWGRNLYASSSSPSNCANPDFCYGPVDGTDLVAEPDGSAAYLVGSLNGFLEGKAFGGGVSDAFAAKYDADGEIVWTNQINGDAVGQAMDEIWATDWDPAGLLAIAGNTDGLIGETRSGVNAQLFLAKLQPSDGSD